MEELGIGRPSTYASILQVLQDRGYVRIDKKRLIPEDKGRVVVGFLESFFHELCRIRLHRRARRAARQGLQQRDRTGRRCCSDFWNDFIGAVDDIKELRITQVLDALNELLGAAHLPGHATTAATARQCPTCGTGKLSLKVGRFGAFIGCSNYPECTLHPAADAGRGRRSRRTKVLGTIRRPASK